MMPSARRGKKQTQHLINKSGNRRRRLILIIPREVRYVNTELNRGATMAGRESRERIKSIPAMLVKPPSPRQLHSILIDFITYSDCDRP